MSDRNYQLTDVSKGHASVVDPETGERVGRVEQRQDRYSLRRKYVVKWWAAYIGGVDSHLGGEAIREEGGRVKHFDTRDAAAQAVIEAA